MSAPAGAPDTLLSAPRCRVVHAWLTVELYALLEREADRRGAHVDQLAADMLTHMLLKRVPGRPSP
jgi:hypothetical protein